MRSLTEAGIWTAGLLAVAIADPTAPPLFDACLFEAVGLSFCPGRGLGHAVGFLARGEFLLSFQSHPMAVPVVGVLIHRIQQLVSTETLSFQPSRSDVQSNQVPSRA